MKETVAVCLCDVWWHVVMDTMGVADCVFPVGPGPEEFVAEGCPVCNGVIETLSFCRYTGMHRSN